MEASQFETLKSSHTPCAFPPHCRRHLRSETFSTLVRIFSHCYDKSQRSHSLPAAAEEPNLDDGGIKLGLVTQCDKFENILVDKEFLARENIEVAASQDRSFTHSQMEIYGLDHVNILKGSEELAHDDEIDLANSLMDENQTSDGVTTSVNNGEHHLSVPRCEVSEALYLTMDVDMIAESVKHVKHYEENRSAVEGNMFEEVEHNLKQKEMEFEKLIYDSGVTNFSFHVTSNKEVEEGEITGDIEVYDDSMDSLFEGAVSLEEERLDEVKICENIIDKEELIEHDQRRGLVKDTVSTPLFVNTFDDVGDGIDLEFRGSSRVVGENNSEMLLGRKLVEAKNADGKYCHLETGGDKKQGTAEKRFICASEAPKNLAQLEKTSGENTAENQGTELNEKMGQDASVLNKKKKRGPLTKEKRAKKKKKEKIRRAEKNRKLGVKRLKLPPVLKPKTVTYCRHYLKGRCQEGEKCKFSHDAIPLTKSTPCCYFARHSCMKGDNCPFDHQLFKYPCNNYLSKGSCVRGADCMFSHEISAAEGSPIGSDASMAEPKSVSLPTNLNFNKQLKIAGNSHQNVYAKTCSIGISPNKNTQQNVAKPVVKPTLQTPKGICFLSHVKSSQCDTNEHKQGVPLPKADEGVKVDCQKIRIQGASDVTQNGNEATKRTPEVAPFGINFLAFGKSSFSLLANQDCGIGKSALCDFTKGSKQTSSSKNNSGVEVDGQTVQTASDIVQNLNEMSKTTPSAVAPRGMNFLSFGKASVDDSSSKRQAGMNSVEDVQEKESALDRVHVSNAMLWKLPPSVSCDQSLCRPAENSMLTSLQNSVLSNVPRSAQKALQSTLAFASKLESGIKSAGAIAVCTNSNKDSRS